MQLITKRLLAITVAAGTLAAPAIAANAADTPTDQTAQNATQQQPAANDGSATGDNAKPTDLASAQAAADAANKQLADAQQAYDKAEQAAKDADTALAKAQDELKAAQGHLADVQKQTENATPEQLQAAKDALKKAQDEKTKADKTAADAKTASDKATAAAETAAETLSAAKTAEASAKGELDAAKKALGDLNNNQSGDLAALKKTLDDATAAKTAADKNNTDAQQKAADAKKALDDATTASKDAVELKAKGAAGYFQKRGSTYALEVLTTSKHTDKPDHFESIKLNQPGDATTLDNLKHAITIVQAVNEYRVQNKLEPSKVADSAIAMGMADVDWSNDTVDHAQQFNLSSENLAWGQTTGKGAADAWYSEIEQYNELVAKYPDRKAWTAEDWYEKAPDDYMAVGHYLNMLNPNARIAGAGYNDAYLVNNPAPEGPTIQQGKASAPHWSTSGWVTVFSADKTDRVMTPEDYLKDIADYEAWLDAQTAAVDKAQKAYDAAKTDADKSAAAAKTAQDALDKAREAYDAAQKQQDPDAVKKAEQLVKDKQAAYDKAHQSTADAQKRSDDTAAAAKTALDKATAAKTAADKADTDVKSAQAEVDALANPEAALEAAKEAVTDAQAKADASQRAKDAADQVFRDASDGLSAAKDAKDKADADLAELQAQQKPSGVPEDDADHPGESAEGAGVTTDGSKDEGGDAKDAPKRQDGSKLAQTGADAGTLLALTAVMAMSAMGCTLLNVRLHRNR